MDVTSTDLTGALARFVSTLDLADVPSDVKADARRLLLRFGRLHIGGRARGWPRSSTDWLNFWEMAMRHPSRAANNALVLRGRYMPTGVLRTVWTWMRRSR